MPEKFNLSVLPQPVMPDKELLFPQVIEFVDFMQRLQQSHTRYQELTERPMQFLRALNDQVPALANGSAPSTSANDLPAVLRVNADLSTRPAWYPPLAGDCGLAPARWWDQCSQLVDQGGLAFVDECVSS